MFSRLWPLRFLSTQEKNQPRAFLSLCSLFYPVLGLLGSPTHDFFAGTRRSPWPLSSTYGQPGLPRHRFSTAVCLRRLTQIDIQGYDVECRLNPHSPIGIRHLPSKWRSSSTHAAIYLQGITTAIRLHSVIPSYEHFYLPRTPEISSPLCPYHLWLPPLFRRYLHP